MVALATVTGPAPALLLLLAALLTGARADKVTWSRCKENPGWHDDERLINPWGDDTATMLNLRQCFLSELRIDAFKKPALPYLRSLALSGNLFDHFNPEVFIPVSHLSDTLNLGNNGLQEVPVFGAHALFPRLKVLHLSINRITSITDNDTFSSCVQLETLDLSENRIEYIEQDIFKQLQNLKILNLNDNKIVSISDTIFRLKSLNELRLYDNFIEYVAPHAFRGTNLTLLYIAGNRLAFLPEHFASDLPASLVGALKENKFSYFTFYTNPWHCACLLELIADVKSFGVRYYDFSWTYSGTKPVCVFLGRRACRRHAPSALLPPPRDAFH